MDQQWRAFWRRPGTSDLLLEDGANPGIRGVNSKENWSSRFRVSQHRNRDKELLGLAEGGVTHRGPTERLPRTLEGVGERS